MIFIFSHPMTEKLDSTVLVPGNTDANLLHKCFSFWNCDPRIPHLPSKDVFEVQASKAALMVSILWYMMTSSQNSSWRPSSSCSLNAVIIFPLCDHKNWAKSYPFKLTSSQGKYGGVSKSELAFKLSHSTTILEIPSIRQTKTSATLQVTNYPSSMQSLSNDFTQYSPPSLNVKFLCLDHGNGIFSWNHKNWFSLILIAKFGRTKSLNICTKIRN